MKDEENRLCGSCVKYELRKQPISAAFPSPSGGATPSVFFSVPPFFFFLKTYDFCSAMRIPNMCLVLKLDNGKVVSIADGQTHRRTEPNSTVF